MFALVSKAPSKSSLAVQPGFPSPVYTFMTFLVPIFWWFHQGCWFCMILHNFLGGEAEQTGTSPDHKLANCHWCCLYLRFAWGLVCRVWDLVKYVESLVSQHRNLMTCLGRQHEEAQTIQNDVNKEVFWCHLLAHFVCLCRHVLCFSLWVAASCGTRLHLLYSNSSIHRFKAYTDCYNMLYLSIFYWVYNMISDHMISC